MVPQRTLNIHGTFQMQKRFFIVEKLSISLFLKVNLYLKMFFKMVNLRTVHWKVDRGIKNGSSMTSLQKHHFGAFILRVYSKKQE